MHGVAPKVIITDQDAQIGDAIKVDFQLLGNVIAFGMYETYCRAINLPDEQVWERFCL